ncbi:FAD-binding protein [Legionella sp. D16C41]|uniref:FAD-binding protein n=1 Tax=Legionella sp. D16C41 TaxID=3402688 RepID=UPI003AF7FB58
MRTRAWKQYHLQYCSEKFPKAFYDDTHLLNNFSYDFGRLITSQAKAVFIPESIESIKEFMAYANENGLPVTIRGNGMSQSGQSLAPSNGVIISTVELNSLHHLQEEFIWVDVNATWSSLIATSLKNNKIPYITPYNCNLSVGGVLSVGGIGAASFRYGSVINHVQALEVITADGQLLQVDASSPLYHACLGGQGQFAIITKACIKLRPCKQNVRTFFLTYLDEKQWLQDLSLLKQCADYIECFCSPAVQGAKLTEKGRKPFAEWLYVLHVSLEFDEKAPQLHDVCPQISPWKVLHKQDESMESYLHRHDGRFQLMKLTGQWELQHPWYECFIPEHILFKHLKELLASLPLHYVPILQIVSIKALQPSGFFILPEAEDIFSIMILNPGLPSALIPSCLEAINDLDELFLPQGGKRYLSGYLGKELTNQYWQKHFGYRYSEWLDRKKQFDPKFLFQSLLHSWQ